MQLITRQFKQAVAVVLLLLLVGTHSYSYSALRLGWDDSGNDVTFTYEQPSYYINFNPNLFDSQENNSLVTCFRLRGVVQSGTGKCTLGDDKQDFTCFNFSSSGNIEVNNVTYDLSVQKSVDVDGSALYNPNNRNVYKFVIQNFFYSNQIYQMVSSPHPIISFKQARQYNFLHTYVNSAASISDDLLMQRNYNCYSTGSIAMLVFSGGVVRDGDAYYMMAFLTISLINKPVYMWGGYSYSSDHVTRDMLGFNSDGDYFDLYSLLAGAPYLDSSENVKGNNDLKMISNSAKNNLGTDIFHYVHLYRLFNTMDSFGDQIIRKKIDNSFCFAAFFTNDPDVLPSPTNSSQKHNFVSCNSVDISLYAPVPALLVAFMLVWLILL